MYCLNALLPHPPHPLHPLTRPHTLPHTLHSVCISHLPHTPHLSPGLVVAPVRFSVLLDDSIAWRSGWIDGAGQREQCCVKVWTGMWGLGAQQHCLRTYVELCIHPLTPSHNPPPMLTHILPVCAGAGDGNAVAAPGCGDGVPRGARNPPTPPSTCSQSVPAPDLPPCAGTCDGSAVAAPGGSHRVLGRRDEQPVPTHPTPPSTAQYELTTHPAPKTVPLGSYR